MYRPLLLFVLLPTLLVASIRAADLSEDDLGKANALNTELMDALRDSNEETAEEALEEIVELPRAAVRIFREQLQRVIDPLEQSYGKLYEQTASELWSGETSPKVRAEVAQLRKTILSIRDRLGAMAEDDAKKLVKNESRPAMDTLINLLEIDPENVSEGNDELAAQRAQLLLCYEALQELERDLGVDSNSAGSRLEKLESGLSMTGPTPPGDIRRVFEQVKSHQDELEAQEYAGIVQLNEWRVMLGLMPCEIDMGLVEAARGHSQDMVDNGFFAHESQLKGKETPWKRAALAGTTASAENIASGQQDGNEANWAWFMSPGHHTNMLADGHTRMGLGRRGNHWTQMFGN